MVESGLGTAVSEGVCIGKDRWGTYWYAHHCVCDEELAVPEQDEASVEVAAALDCFDGVVDFLFMFIFVISSSSNSSSSSSSSCFDRKRSSRLQSPDLRRFNENIPRC